MKIKVEEKKEQKEKRKKGECAYKKSVSILNIGRENHFPFNLAGWLTYVIIE